jgi:hypothetical protein
MWILQFWSYEYKDKQEYINVSFKVFAVVSFELCRPGCDTMLFKPEGCGRILIPYPCIHPQTTRWHNLENCFHASVKELKQGKEMLQNIYTIFIFPRKPGRNFA